MAAQGEPGQGHGPSLGQGLYVYGLWRLADELRILAPENLSKYDVIANFTTFLEATQERNSAWCDRCCGPLDPK